MKGYTQENHFRENEVQRSSHVVWLQAHFR